MKAEWKWDNPCNICQFAKTKARKSYFSELNIINIKFSCFDGSVSLKHIYLKLLMKSVYLVALIEV